MISKYRMQLNLPWAGSSFTKNQRFIYLCTQICLALVGKHTSAVAMPMVRLLVTGEDGTTTKDIGNIRTVHVSNRRLKRGHFTSSRLVREFEIKPLWLFAVPRPDKFANSDQPCGSISELNAGNFLGVDEGKGSRCDPNPLLDLHGWVIGSVVLDFEHIEEKVEVSELAYRFADHFDGDLLIDRPADFVFGETERVSWNYGRFFRQEFCEAYPGGRNFIPGLELGSREGTGCESLSGPPSGELGWPPGQENFVYPRDPHDPPDSDKLSLSVP